MMLRTALVTIFVVSTGVACNSDGGQSNRAERVAPNIPLEQLGFDVLGYDQLMAGLMSTVQSNPHSLPGELNLIVDKFIQEHLDDFKGYHNILRSMSLERRKAVLQYLQMSRNFIQTLELFQELGGESVMFSLLMTDWVSSRLLMNHPSITLETEGDKVPWIGSMEIQKTEEVEGEPSEDGTE